MINQIDTDSASSEIAQDPETASSTDEERRPAAAPRRVRDPFVQYAAFTGEDDLSGDLWSVPWSDLMMVMFVMFAALLAAKMLQPDIEIRYKTLPQPEIVEIEKERVIREEIRTRKPSFEPLMQINVFDRSQDAVLEKQLQNIDIALLEDQSVKISVQGPMFFERGKSDLLPEMTDFLDRLARVIVQTPYQIHVIGHTDDNPIKTLSFPSNWELSVVRASRVARHLIRSASIDPTRFVVMGRGQYEPAYPNEDDEKRALNRRVEIIITRELADAGNQEE